MGLAELMFSISVTYSRTIILFCFQVNIFTLCLLAFVVLAMGSSSEVEEDDMALSESSRSARFLRLRWPSKKIRIKKRIGPLGLVPLKQPISSSTIPSIQKKNKLLIKKKQRIQKPPTKLAPTRDRTRDQIQKPKPVFKKKPLLKKNLPKRHLPSHKKPKAILAPPHSTPRKPSTPSTPIRRPPPKRIGQIADERFFFGRGRKRRRPQGKKPSKPQGNYKAPKKPKKQKKRPSRPKYKRPKPKPKPTKGYKPPPKKTTTYKPTTKAPSYEEPTAPPYKPPAAPSYEAPSYGVEVTSFKPPAEVYEPSTDVDNFPSFPNPDFPEFMASFMPDFNFDFAKINCKYSLLDVAHRVFYCF